MTQGATQYEPESPTGPAFLRRCPDINAWIAAVCDRERTAHGRTLSDLADLTGILRPVISKWRQAGGPRPRDRSVEAFCCGLGLDAGPVLIHFGYVETPLHRRSRKVRAAIAAFEDVLAEPGLSLAERQEYERQALSLLDWAFRHRPPHA
ncbi:helix-turn-helix domain-containing protein [Glycomyces sp. A-F 0318]|uniref:helix-turn-helix domain-containing protein n=1 Tax=Glycomyces amatae TaxID=2881355 RepID=UPI001E5FA8C5|nr:helix-turn-helix domain-containing protein [Glycomyces amatae]MCD0446344.1 helix-turn-helix domain-containing protein [Glycomyces amatae]